MITQQCILEEADSTEPIFGAVFCGKKCKGLTSKLGCFYFCLSKDIRFNKCTDQKFCFVCDKEMATEAEKRRCLQFSGEEDDFAYWSEKFEGYMHTKKLRGQLLGTDASNDNEKYIILAELVQCLDKRSILMLKSECNGNVPEAWKPLTAHFSSSHTPRMMNLLEQLTSLSLKPAEEMTDYLIRAETLSSSLEIAGEKISEKLLVSVVLKGLPDSYEYFMTVHGFSKTPTPFSDLKKALKNFANFQKLKDCGNSSETKSEAALFVSRDNSEKFSGNCFRCNKSGHIKMSCTVKECSICKEFGEKESKCFQKSKMDKNSDNKTNFLQSCEFSFYRGSGCSESNELILDSSCISHIICDNDFFVEVMMFFRKFVWMQISVSPVKGQSVAKIFLLDKRGASHVLNLSGCFYVPDHSRNLLFLSAFGQKGAKVVFDDTCQLRCSDEVPFPFVQRNGLYVTKAFSVCSSIFSSRCRVDLDLWHCRLGHNNKSDVGKLSKSVQKRKWHISSFSESFCDICAANKLNRKPTSSMMALRKSSKLELVLSDVRGPMETTPLGGHRYVVSFIDSYSRFVRAYFMKHKSEVLEKFRQFCIDEGVLKTFSSLTLNSDGGGEYDNRDFDEFCFAQGIKRQMTAPYSPHQNAVA